MIANIFSILNMVLFIFTIHINVFCMLSYDECLDRINFYVFECKRLVRSNDGVEGVFGGFVRISLRIVGESNS